MPHLIAIAAAAALFLYYAYRWVCRETERVEAAMTRTDRRIRKSARPVLLAYDASTGVYRPLN